MTGSPRPSSLPRSSRANALGFARGLAAATALLSLAWVSLPQSGEAVLETFDFSADSGHRAILPLALVEVSGLATTPDGRLFAHDDEWGVIYQLDPGTGATVKAFSLGFPPVAGDFEGLAIVEGRFFLGTSGGQLLEFREGAPGTTVEFRTYDTGLGRRCEMEGLAYDPVDEALLMPCKTTRDPGLEGYLVVFSVPLSSMRPELMPRVFLPLADLDEQGLGKHFHPSAIEVHPETGSFLLVTAREEALVEVTRFGEILATKELKKKRHPQPEGLAFVSGGGLILADEGQEGPGALTRYDPEEGEGGKRDPVGPVEHPGSGGEP